MAVKDTTEQPQSLKRYRTMMIVTCMCATITFTLLLNSGTQRSGRMIETAVFGPPNPRNNNFSLYSDKENTVTSTFLAQTGTTETTTDYFNDIKNATDSTVTAEKFNDSLASYLMNNTMTSEASGRITDKPYMDDSTITSANYSTLTLLNIPLKGQYLHLLIHAADVQGRPKTSGGDVWFVTASSVDDKFYTSGRVLDHLNGTYSVYLFAGWTNTPTIKVKLVYTSHAAHFIENSYWTTPLPRVYWSAHFIQGNRTESSKCYIETVEWDDTKCAYTRPIAMGVHTAFVCNKPRSLPCVALNDYLVDSGKTNRAVENFGTGNMWLFSGCMEYIGNGTIVTLKPDVDAVNDSTPLNVCLPDEPNPWSHGYWSQSKWVSFVCKTRQWTRPEAGKCLQDKEIILLGDSTTRQWYTELVHLLGGNSNLKGVELVVKTKSIPAYNTTVYWHFHPWTIGSVRKYIANLKYEVDILDELSETNCSKYVIVVSPWAHFTQWRRSAYIERLGLLRLAVERLQKRCPGVPVVVRGPHPRLELVGTPSDLFSAADYILYKMNTIMRDMFYGIGVHYIDIWDLNLSYPSKNTIHMPSRAVAQEIFMFLSYLCNTGK
ncbi:NXPE family member 3-like [Amphiura filiformis]|uniref:NXPE family member 3-like n=1 Tax=Amphiura filiformis TaxID=82378 RepID=UPI003B220DC8